MSNDETYGPERADRLVSLLRELAARIGELDRGGHLLDATPELLRLLGSARSELFHYEVRLTYDTPDIAESRRIVDEATRSAPEPPFGDDEDLPWRRRDEE